MPRVKNKTKSGTIRIHRPEGTCFSEAESDVSFMRSTAWGHLLASFGMDESFKLALTYFRAEFSRLPREPYVVEAVVSHGKVRLCIYETEVGDD